MSSATARRATTAPATQSGQLVWAASVPVSRGDPGWVTVDAGGEVAAGPATVKVKVSETGWPSEEVTRQSTR